MRTTKLASLPMYDLPELREVTDAWWAGLAQAFRREGIRDVPPSLHRSEKFGAEWRDSALLFSQCCGLDYLRQGQEPMHLLATPSYDVADCQGAQYCSLLMVRTDDSVKELADLRDKRAAVNMPGSHSGYNALRFMIAPLARKQAFFQTVLHSGSHAGSLLAVQEKRADCTAVDCVSFALLQRYRNSATEGLRVLARSPHVPGLPYVCHRTLDSEQRHRLQNGLQAAFSDPRLAAVRTALLLRSLHTLTPETYQPISAMAAEAQRLGYPEVA